MKDNKPALIISVNRRLLLTLFTAAFALGIYVGAGMGLFTPPSDGKGVIVADNTEGVFRFIRGSVEPNEPSKMQTKELKPFKYKVNALIENSLKSGEAAAVSTYFLDLNNGNWFGIREHAKFSPKNLLKLPLMIAYFKWAETNPLVLRKQLVAAKKREKHHSSANELESGKPYSVNDLIFRMIAHDDAGAYDLLYSSLPVRRLDKIFKDLNVEYDPYKQEDNLSLNAFTAFYRVLFNASYLSEDMSEKALRFLSKSTYRNDMASAIPLNIDIAGKRGERRISAFPDGDGNEPFQLHEFGIIYHPNRPFLLGIMVRGNDFDRMAHVIRNITRLVYEEVDRQS